MLRGAIDAQRTNCHKTRAKFDDSSSYRTDGWTTLSAEVATCLNKMNEFTLSPSMPEKEFRREPEVDELPLSLFFSPAAAPEAKFSVLQGRLDRVVLSLESITALQ